MPRIITADEIANHEPDICHGCGWHETWSEVEITDDKKIVYTCSNCPTRAVVRPDCED